MKITPESMKKQYEDMWNIFCKKNHDYGSSFERSLDKHGLVAGVVRMEDKMNRISTLVDVDKHSEIASESLSDTLRDLSNYSAMAACWLDGPDDVDDEIIKNWALMEDKMNRISTLVDDEFDDHISKGFSGHVVVTDEENLEKMKSLLHLSSFEGHQEKVNERAYYNRDDVTDDEIIKNWAPVGDNKTVRSRTTGQYLTEDDNPELFRKIFGVLRAHYGYESFKKLKGLENGYFIRQHINNNYRYTLAFNPEGTIKTENGEDKPYVLECFGNDGMNVWAIHVFDTLEDMVAALNYDLKVRNKFKSKSFGESIKGLDIINSVYAQHDAPLVFETWINAFGQEFDNNMRCTYIFSDGIFGAFQGIKTFGPVFISEKTGALVVKGILYTRTTGLHNIIWFSDTKEVLLEVNNVIPKFNDHGIIYGVDSELFKNVDNLVFNPLYNNMEDKILSKFHTWDGSELKNLVFFNEDE